jgi:sulfate permease, SulP family
MIRLLAQGGANSDGQGHEGNRLFGTLSRRAGQVFPLGHSLKAYRWQYLLTDLVAGITVGAVTVPSAMAYAQVAGLPPVIGLYAGLGAMVVFAVFSDSRQLIVGPEVALATITGATLANLSGGNPQRALQLAVMLALMVGIFCALGALIRLGFIAELLSRPILLGYLMGIALVIIAAQLPKMFGFSIPRGDFFITIWRFLTNLGQTHVWTLVFSISLLALGLVISRFWKKVPAALVLLVAALLLSHFLDLSSQGFSVVGNVQKGLPSFTLPHLSWKDIIALLPTALAMSVVAFADTITPIRAYAAKANEATSANRAFFSLGTANLASGFLGGMPISASGARTALNYSLGAKSQVSQLAGAATIAATLLVLTPVLKDLPTAALAVILVLAAIQLFDFKELASIWRAWRFEGVLAIVAMVGVAGVGVLYGLGLAIVLAVLNLLYRSAYPHDAVLGRLAGEAGYRDLTLWPEARPVPGLVVYRFDAPLFFANANHFRERVKELISSFDEPVEWLVLDMEQVFYVDSTASAMFAALLGELESMDVSVAIARMKGPVRETFARTDIAERVESLPAFPTVGEAGDYFERRSL